MSIAPVVRYMLLCEDWWADPTKEQRITIEGLLSSIRSLDDPPYPLLFREFCVFLILTEGYGQGEGRIVCTFEETGTPIFEAGPRPIPLKFDPLEVVGVPFRIRNLVFPSPGLYSVQFWYGDEMLAEHPLRLR